MVLLHYCAEHTRATSPILPRTARRELQRARQVASHRVERDDVGVSVNDPERGTVSAGRVADVLLAVADASGATGVSELARELELSKAVVYRILRSLVDRGLVSDASGRGAYTLGGEALRLGARALGSSDLRLAALPVLRELQAKTGETTTVSALIGRSRVYLDQVVSSKEIRMTVELGAAFPLHVGGSGKAILAFAAGDLREWVLGGELARMTQYSITDRATLERVLEEVRDQGVATSRGERESSAASVAAPVLGLEGTAIGSISVCGPRERLEPSVLAALAPVVREAAAQVTAAAAHRGAPG